MKKTDMMLVGLAVLNIASIVNNIIETRKTKRERQHAADNFKRAAMDTLVSIIIADVNQELAKLDGYTGSIKHSVVASKYDAIMEKYSDDFSTGERLKMRERILDHFELGTHGRPKKVNE